MLCLQVAHLPGCLQLAEVLFFPLLIGLPMSLENEWPPASSLGEVQLSATELEPYLLAQEHNGTITVNFAKSKLFNP